MYEAALYEARYDARNPQNWNQKVEISTKSDRDEMLNDVRNSSEPFTSAPAFTEITSESTVLNDEQGMVTLHIICCISNTKANRMHNEIQRACNGEYREVGTF